MSGFLRMEKFWTFLKKTWVVQLNLSIFLALAGFGFFMQVPNVIIANPPPQAGGPGGGASGDLYQGDKDQGKDLETGDGTDCGCGNFPFSTMDGTVNFDITEFDHSRPGFPFRFSRHYNSRRSSDSRHLGEGWMTNYDSILQFGTTPETQDIITLLTPTGKYTFSKGPGNQLVASGSNNFGRLEKIGSCSEIPTEVRTHPNADSAACGSGHPVTMPFDQLFLHTDKFGTKTYFARIFPSIPMNTLIEGSDDNVFRPLISIDIKGNYLRYIYQNYLHTRITSNPCSNGGCPPNTKDYLKHHLLRVEAGPHFTWQINFEYHSGQDFQTAISNSGNHLIYGETFLKRVTSSVGDGIDFSFPSTAGLPYGNDSPTKDQLDTVTRTGPGIITAPSRYKYLFSFSGRCLYSSPLGGSQGGVCNWIPSEYVAVIIEKEEPLDAPRRRKLKFNYFVDSQTEDAAKVFKLADEKNWQGEVLNSLSGANYGGILSGQPSFDATLSNANGVERVDHYEPSSENGIVRTRATWGSTGGIQEFLYDNKGQIIRLRLRNAASTAVEDTNYGYDALGNRTLVSDAMGNSTFATYDSFSRILSSTDARGNVTSFSYIGPNLDHVSGPLGLLESYTYHPNRLVETKTTLVSPGVSHVESYIYDSNGNLQSSQSPLQSKPPTFYSFDPAGLSLAVTNPMGTTRTLHYTREGKIREEIDTNMAETDRTYDQNGNLLDVTKQGISTTRHIFNDDDEMTDRYEAWGDALYQRHSRFEFDPHGNMTRVRDGEDRETKMTYNSNELLTSILIGTNPSKSFTYDFANRVKKVVDERGVVATHNYFANGWLQGITYSDGTPPVSFTYDRDGRRASMSDGEGLKTYTYDQLGRLRFESNSALNLQSENVYDLKNRRTELKVRNTLAAGAIVDRWEYVFDADDRLTEVRYFSGNAAVPQVTQYTHNNLDQVATASILNGAISSRYGYHATNHNLTQVAHVNFRGESLTFFNYTHDDFGNVLSQSSLTGTETYQYNPLEELRIVDRGATLGNQTYLYDKAGNRMSLTPSQGPPSSYSYNNMNQLQSHTLSATLSYDFAGNLTFDGVAGNGKAYAWDARNRLKQVGTTSGGIPTYSLSYIYNGENRRVKKTLNGVTRSYYFDSSGLLYEIEGGFIVKRYNPGISFRDSNGQDSFYLHNGHGDVARIVDKDGNITQTYEYEPFGAVRGGADKVNGHRYVADGDVYSDDDAGLQYMWNRWYDPETGRFISRDPIGFEGGLNLYAYVGNNPKSEVDPLGLDPMADLKFFMGPLGNFMNWFYSKPEVELAKDIGKAADPTGLLGGVEGVAKKGAEKGVEKGAEKAIEAAAKSKKITKVMAKRLGKFVPVIGHAITAKELADAARKYNDAKKKEAEACNR